MTTEHILALAGVCSFAVSVGLILLAYWYLPRSVSQVVERLHFEENAGIPPNERDYHYAISFDSSAFTVTNLRDRRQEAVTMSWQDVSQVTAFKRDLFTVDCICLFLARSDDIGVELDEEMASWKSFIEALPQYLPGCKPWSEWFMDVAFPAFETKLTLVYDRASTRTDQIKE